MRKIGLLAWIALSVFLMSGFGGRSAAARTPPVRIVALKAADGVRLKASYFAAARTGPGMLLLQQGNRDRKDWDGLARRLAQAGINTLTLDLRGYGDSEGASHDRRTPEEAVEARNHKAADLDMAFQYLVSQPGVKRDDIGLAGAGAFGVDNAVRTAQRHAGQVKSLVLLSGETFQDGLQFLADSPGLPELFVVANDDEYPPTVEAMEWLYAKASSPGKRFLRYPGHEAPWLGLEQAPWVRATGSHGTDLFGRHPQLQETIADWCVTTLVRTPGRAPPRRPHPPVLPSAAVLKLLDAGQTQAVAKLLAQTRWHDPRMQLFPEINANIIGYDKLRAGDPKAAVSILELVALAYPRSADAFDSLTDAYLAAGDRAAARTSATKALALLDGPDTPKGSMWQETPERRALIRRNIKHNLDVLGAKAP